MPDWNDFPIEPSAPDPATAFPVPDNGFQLVFLWAAGPERGSRVPAEQPRFATVATVTEDGQHSSHREPLTEDDLADIDESVNAYLAEAGLPARPRGYDWFCATPPSLQDSADPARELFYALNMELGANQTTAADTLRAAGTVLDRYF